MERDEQYSVYRTPFRIKSKQESKNSPSQTDHTNYQSAAALQMRISDSPYSTKYARSHQSLQKPRTPIHQGQAFTRSQQVRHFRMKSAPQNKAYDCQPAAQSDDPFSLQFHHQIKAKNKTQRECTSRNGSRKKKNVQNELFPHTRYHSQRKFTVSMVDVQKNGQIHRNLVKKKLQAYDYKTVLNKPLASGSKKLPRLVISEEGVVRLERS